MYVLCISVIVSYSDYNRVIRFEAVIIADVYLLLVAKRICGFVVIMVCAIQALLLHVNCCSPIQGS